MKLNNLQLLFFFPGYYAVGRTTFITLWKKYVPFIVVGRPMTDLCWHCKQNNDKIRRSAYLPLPEQEKALMHTNQIEHLRIVESERKFYNTLVEQSKAVVSTANITQLAPNRPNSLPAKLHYSFDFAQQVHLPSSPQQPGPIYFLVPRKCGIFGICCEALPQQMNYLIDEGMCVSKGSNMVISLLHHFFENFGLGEMEVDLHCDNCSGQNKNRFVLWYLAWRVMRGLHTNITVNFMPPGHTKFAPDWCFGLLKKKFRHAEVHCLDDLCHVVENSTLRGINRAQLLGTESGEVHVSIYDWQNYFNGWFRPLKGIKAIQHFSFSSTTPGIVFYKKHIEDVETQFQLAIDTDNVLCNLTALPAVLPPPGLTADRQQYLRQHIRQFVRPDMQDRLCP